MLLAVLIIQKRFFRYTLLQRFHGHNGASVGQDVTVEHHHLQRIQRRARVPVGKIGDHLQHALCQLHPPAAEAARVCQRPAQQLRKLPGRKTVQHKHLAPGQKRRVDLERRVFRGGADEDDASLFHKGQKRILLRFVEAVDLVHEQDGLFAEAAVRLGRLHHFLDLFDTACHGAEINEICLRPVGDDARKRRFAHARRPPEHHGGHTVAVYELAQHLALAQKMPLARKFLQGSRAHPAGQRPPRVCFPKQCLLYHTPCLPALSRVLPAAQAAGVRSFYHIRHGSPMPVSAWSTPVTTPIHRSTSPARTVTLDTLRLIVSRRHRPRA